MAEIILTYVAQAIVSAYGLSVAAGVALGIGASYIGGIIDRSLFGSKPSDYYGPRLNDLTVQTSTEGASLPIVYGTMRIAGNVIWSTGLQETATTTEAGGGSGGDGPSSTTYSYKTDAAVAVCEGTITGIRRIWADTKLIYDVGDAASAETLVASGNNNIRFYTGSETQLCDPLIQAITGTDLAFRGTAYVVFENLELANYGNRLPNFSFEVVKSGSTSALTTLNNYTSNILNIDKIISIKTKLGSPTKLITFSGTISATIPYYGHRLSFYYLLDDGQLILRKSFILYTPAYGPYWNWSSYSINTEGSEYEDDSVVLGQHRATLITMNKNNILEVRKLAYYNSLSFTSSYITEEFVITTDLSNVIIFKKSSLEILNTPIVNHTLGDGYAIPDIIPPYTYYAIINFSEQCFEAKVIIYKDILYIATKPQGGTSMLYKLDISNVLNYGGTYNYTTLLLNSYTLTYYHNIIGLALDGGILLQNSNSIITKSYDLITWTYVGNTNYTLDFGRYFIKQLSKYTYLIMEDSNGTKLFSYSNGTIAIGTQTVKEVVEDLVNKADIPSSKYDFSTLNSDIVRGYAIARSVSSASAIEPLLKVYSFQLREEDGKLLSKKLINGTNVKDINIDTLGVIVDG